MSVQAISWALSVEAGSPSAKCTLLCIANYADEHGRCWPAQSTIAKQSEQSVDTVQRRIKDLEAAGLLTRQERPDQNGKAGGRFLYQLSMVQPADTLDIETTPHPAARSKTMPQPTLNLAANPEKPCRTVAALTAILKPSRNPSEEDSISWPTDFEDQFWKRYPRRIGKTAALRALTRVKKSNAVAWPTLMAALDKFAKWAATKEIQYVKHPATWLNAGCWDDEISDAEFNVGGHDGPTGPTMFDIATGNHRKERTA